MPKKDYTKKRFVIREQCPYSGIVLDGEVTTLDDDDKEVRTEIIKNTTDSTFENILEKVKPECAICGRTLYTKSTTDKKKVEIFCTRGNWCLRCNGETKTKLL